MTDINFSKLPDFQNYFSEEKTCMEYYKEIRWPEGISCPFCQSQRYYALKKPYYYKCADNACYRKYNLFTNTIFSKSKITLNTWFSIIYMVITHTKGWSSKQTERNFKVSQGGAWFMLHRIRHAMKIEDRVKLSGIIEMDEAFFGPIAKNMHWDKKPVGVNLQGRSTEIKTPIIGMAQRYGELRLFVTEDASMATINKLIEENVEPGTTIYSDEHTGYNGVKLHHVHDYVRHSKKEYVSQNNLVCHTNKIEGSWGHLKRGFKGTYLKPQKKHLQRYCDEFSFTYNTKETEIMEKFNLLLEQTISKRLKFHELTRKAA